MGMMPGFKVRAGSTDVSHVPILHWDKMCERSVVETEISEFFEVSHMLYTVLQSIDYQLYPEHNHQYVWDCVHVLHNDLMHLRT